MRYVGYKTHAALTIPPVIPPHRVEQHEFNDTVAESSLSC